MNEEANPSTPQGKSKQSTNEQNPDSKAKEPAASGDSPGDQSWNRTRLLTPSERYEEPERFPQEHLSNSWQDDPVERARRDAQESYDNGAHIPGYTGPFLSKTPSAIKVYATLIYCPFSAAPRLSQSICYVSTARRDRFAALKNLASAHEIAADRADVPLTVAEVIAAAVVHECTLDEQAPPLIDTILSAVSHRSCHWIAVVPSFQKGGKVIYGSVDEEDYFALREELSRETRRDATYEDLLRLVMRMAAPVGSNVDRFITMNGTRHPEDPLAIGR